MRTVSIPVLAPALTVAVTATLAWQARVGGELVKFPESFAKGVLYATVLAATSKRRSSQIAPQSMP